MKRCRPESIPETREPELPDWIANDDKNPMLNHLVVERMFEVIPFNSEHFMDMRLVSKLFWKSSLSTWRQNAWLSVKGRLYSGISTGVNFKHYLEMLEKPVDPFQLQGRAHFQKYNLEDWEFKFLGRANQKKLEFLSAVGPSITHLQCSNSVFFRREDFQHVVFDVTPNLQFLSLKSNEYKCGRPSIPGGRSYSSIPPVWKESIIPPPEEVLRKLTNVEISLEDKFSGNTEFPLCWMDFFARAPNVKVLKLQNLSPRSPENSYVELTNLFQCVELLREKIGPEVLAQLEELDILTVRLYGIGQLPPTFTTHLRNLAFPLKSLAFDIGYENRKHEDNLKEILDIHSNTLQKLVVYRGPYLGTVAFNFPFGVELAQLTELRFIGKVCKNLWFLQDTPNLKTLVLMDDGTPNDSAMAMLKDYEDFSLRYLHQKKIPDMKPIPRSYPLLPLKNFTDAKMEGLVLPKMEVFIASLQVCDEKLVEAMARVMPNLKKLGIGLNNRGFERVCENWKELKALHINPFNVDEDAILGIENGKKYCRPNLTDLKRLKFLSTGRNTRDVGLSNDSVVYGLFVLPHLEDVSLELIPEVTKDVFDKLVKKFPRLENQICFEDDEESEGSCSNESDEDSKMG